MLINAINKSSNKVTFVKGTLIHVPKQAHWNLSFFSNFIPTPIDPITMIISVIIAAVER